MSLRFADLSISIRRIFLDNPNGARLHGPYRSVWQTSRFTSSALIWEIPVYVMGTDYSPDGSLLATGAGGSAILPREAETGAIKARRRGHRTGILAQHDVGISGLAFDHIRPAAREQ